MWGDQMDIRIGENIKKLRKKHHVTQEKLAEYLGISYQAVSKWENGTSFPDITLVPTLARFFGVSTDEIFGFAPDEKVSKKKEFETQYQILRSSGDVRGMILLMRKALEEDPRNYQFMLNLAQALTSLNAFNASKEQEIRSIEEAVHLCEIILEDCSDDPIRHQAVQILCIHYPLLGRLHEAEKLVEYMPNVENSRELLLEKLLTGEAKIKQTQRNMLSFIDHAATSLVRLAFDKTMGANLSYMQKIQYVEAANKLYEAVFPDGNYLEYHRRFAWNYRRLAELWCTFGDQAKAMQCLEEAAKHAEIYDHLPEQADYTSIFLTNQKYHRIDSSKNWKGTECGMLYYRMSESVFDQLRDLPEFRELFDRLSQNAVPS